MQLKVNFGSPIVVFDTETGGLDSEDLFDFSKDPSTAWKPGDPISATFVKNASPILELGAVKLDPLTLKETDHFHAYLGPEPHQTVDDLFSLCDASALEKNNLLKVKDKFVKAEPGSVVLRRFVKWATKEGKNFIPAGQNVRFDINMLNAAFGRLGIDYQIWHGAQELGCFARLYFALPDTPVVANYKLTTIATALGISTEGAHEALSDARMTSECLRRIYNRFGL